jgi:hypothetical protein
VDEPAKTDKTSTWIMEGPDISVIANSPTLTSRGIVSASGIITTAPPTPAVRIKSYPKKKSSIIIINLKKL